MTTTPSAGTIDLGQYNLTAIKASPAQGEPPVHEETITVVNDPDGTDRPLEDGESNVVSTTEAAAAKGGKDKKDAKKPDKGKDKGGKAPPKAKGGGGGDDEGDLDTGAPGDAADAQADPVDISLQVLVDPASKKMAEKLYTSYVHDMDFSKFPSFMFALDNLLQEFGGQPLPPEEEPEPEPASRFDRSLKDANEQDGDEPEERDYEEKSHLNPRAHALASAIAQRLLAMAVGNVKVHEKLLEMGYKHTASGHRQHQYNHKSKATPAHLAKLGSALSEHGYMQQASPKVWAHSMRDTRVHVDDVAGDGHNLVMFTH